MPPCTVLHLHLEDQEEALPAVISLLSAGVDMHYIDAPGYV